MDEGTLTNLGNWVSELIKALTQDKAEAVLPIIFLFVFLMVVDYFSGMLASKKEAAEHPGDQKYGWSSKKSMMGIYKKLGYLLTILVALSTDYIIYVLLEEMEIGGQSRTVFGFMVTIWFVVNEIISILENVGRMGVSLPKFLHNILAEMKKGLDDYGE